MNSHAPIFTRCFENSLLWRVFLHGKSLRKTALMAGQYMDVPSSTYFNEGKTSGRFVKQAMCEGQIHWTFSWVPLSVLYTSVQKLKNQCRKHTTLSSTQGLRLIVHVLSNLLLWRGHLQQCSTRSIVRCKVTLPRSPCPSSVLNETFKVFRMWVISNFFVSKGHGFFDFGVGFFFFNLKFTITEPEGQKLNYSHF